jgi:1-phosphatidylinositol-3-phosphate 5-kinase
MLEQAIARAGLPNAQEWHRILSGILLKVSSHVSPNVQGGDSIDVRAYVKIKKVPGGKITDSEYVDGIVISKNVAHKAMPRRLVNPRIMVVTFPLDYHRVENQFMSLDPIMAQEKDYLRLLTRRIIDVRPHIVLVERSASRIALDHLLAAGIAVARCVKLSAVHQVARCTQADVVASMDRLALEPRLGRCAEFSIQSFDHEMIPGRRKTIMRFEGCQRELGCTIILRGGDITTLRKVKQITDFMSFVAYQLKNEMILYSDEHNILPIRPMLQTEYQQLLANLAEKEVLGLANSAATLGVPSSASGSERQVDSAGDRTDAEAQTKDIARSLEPYLTTIFSASASIRFPPPAPLVRMAELDRKLHALLRQRDEDETKEILKEERKEPRPVDNAPAGEAAEPSETAAVIQQSLSALVPPPTAVPSTSQRLRDPYRVLRKPEEITRDSNIAQLQHAHSEYLKFWQLYNRRHPAPLAPENYQNLIYLFSLGWDGGEKPCVEPTLQLVDYYQSDDVTLGQFMETLTADAAKRCPNKACDRLLLMHFRLLVHGERRLQIAMDQFPCPSPGHEDRIITWSYCRICAVPSPTTIMRDETWKMSWGAYLEHCFYPPQTTAGFNCEHDAFRDQIRYFAHRNLAIRIHNESIDLYDPVRPSITLQTKAETKVTIKNQEYEAALQKTAAFFDSVLRRLRAFDQDICHPEKVGSLHTALEGLLTRAVADREEIVTLLNRSYKLSSITDVLALNAVLRALQDKVVQWDTDFADVEKNYLPSEKDLRRMTASHLKRLFAQQDGLVGSLDKSVAGLTVSEADEKDGRRDTEEILASCDSSIAERPAPSRVASEGSGLSRDDDMTTPMATITERRDPLSPNSQGGESDSTIGKNDVIRHTPLVTPGIDTSEMESDGYFVSRIPRRAKPAAR